MEPIVFGEKIRRPEQRGLVRDRLVGRLTDPAGPYAGLVLGPAGSGKTTLLSNAVATAPYGAWYRASAEDDDESGLVRHLATALGVALGQDQVAGCAVSGSLSELIEALQSVPDRPFVLAIDDLHELAGSPAESALERFLQLRPRWVRVLMAGRRPPEINTSRMLVSGELCQLDSDDLRFRSWEVEELFRTVYGHPLSPSAAAALTRRTGGWAAGLQLFHLATSRLAGPDRERAVEELSRSRLIRSYLARNVLDGLTPQRRRFLLQTCTLGVMTGELCDALMDTQGSAAVLDDLETEQFFTTSIDGGLSYRYHQVLQSYLEVLLADELGGRATRALYARSAALLERSGRISAAVRAYARAEDWTAVARLAPQQGAAAAPDDDGLRNAVGATGVPDDPMLALAAARRLLRNGRVGPAVTAFRQAESLLDDPDFRRHCAAERAAAMLWLPQSGDSPTDRTWAAYPERGGRVAADLRLVTRSDRHGGLLSTGLARSVAALLAGDRPTALQELDRAAAEAPPDSGEELAVRLVGQLAAVGQQPVDTMLIELDEIVLDADAAGQPWLSRMARGLQAAALLVQNPGPARITGADQVIAECEAQEDLWGACLLGCIIGAVRRRVGGDTAADRVLGTAARHAARLGAPILQQWVADRRVDALLVELPAARPVTMIKELPLVELTCLGGFSLRVDGTEVGWRALRPRAQKLLMLLATRHGRELHREWLIDTLWPDAGTASGTRSLQVAMSSVRQCLIAAGLGEDCVRRRGDSYALRLAGVHDQLSRFEALVAEAARIESSDPDRALRARLEALDLYIGDLLPEVGPDEWVVEERDRLRVLAASAASDAARLAARRGDLVTGIRAARRSIDLDPYHDPAWRLLTHLQQRAGDHSGAMITHREHVRVRADLGLPA